MLNFLVEAYFLSGPKDMYDGLQAPLLSNYVILPTYKTAATLRCIYILTHYTYMEVGFNFSLIRETVKVARV